MNINTLISELSKTVANDSALTNWAVNAYGQSHNVFINMDLRDPPKDTDCPYLVILPLSKSVGRGREEKTHEIEISCCVYDDDFEIHAETNITEFAGSKRLEEFRKLAETVIANSDIGNALIESVDIEYDVVSSFPFMWVGMVFEITEQFVFGSDPLE